MDASRALRRGKSQRSYTGLNASAISSPLGGIGTGYVGLTGIGGLRDWAIYNRPNFVPTLPRTFPILWARAQGEAAVCRVVKGPELPPFIGGAGGDPHASGEGFPHMDDCAFYGEYPFAWIEFESRALPVEVSLLAHNPFIPSNPDDSGYPAAILRYTLRNKRRKPVEATLAWSLLNSVGSIGEAERDARLGNVECGFGGNFCETIAERGLRGLRFTSNKWPESHPRFGSMALLTPERRATILKYWLRAPWFAPVHDFWDSFSSTGRFPERDYPPSEEGQTDAGAVGARIRLKPGESKDVTFYLTWYFPNFEKYWGDTPCCEPGECCTGSEKPKRHVWRNYYATQFADAVDVARRLHRNEKRLFAETARFHNALFDSTLPATVLDAVSSQMSILKSATVLRLTDGTFYGFEGCSPMGGCCEGSCTHVWNYQQALPFLFPSLERSMRTADFRHNLRPDGGMCFRLQLPPGTPPNDYHACGDGQMGNIVKTYRDWKISGDDDWLRSVWPAAKAALEFAWKDWDPDRNGVMEGIQHNTYDIEFHGPNPLMGAFYLAALEAGARIAEHLGEADRAETYRAVAGQGRAWLDTHLFNGEYYVQRYDPDEAPRYQFGDGCLSDQLLGQWLAHVAGLGYSLDRRNERHALRSVFKYNWKRDLSAHANAQRVYALGKEAGLLLCTWPRGGRPAVPFPYSDEVWTGIEYPVASHLIIEGMVEEGLAIVKGARDRHDGLKRNPWDEFECGHHYARAMSSYGLLLALSGFTYDKGEGRIGFEPRIDADEFRCFWALDGCWGMYEQRRTAKRFRARIRILHGRVTLRRLELTHLPSDGRVKVAITDGRLVDARRAEGAVVLSRPVHMAQGDVLTVS